MNWFEPTNEQVQSYSEWVEERPPSVRALIKEKGFAPWKLYNLQGTRQRVFVYGFHEDDDDTITLSVIVDARFNFVFMERRVFGIDPKKLIECDLPEPGEIVGNAGFTD